MSDEELAAIEGRCKAAGTEEWVIDPDDPFHVLTESGRFVATTERRTVTDDDARRAAFIAGAKQEVPTLVAEVRRLRAELARRDEEEEERIMSSRAMEE